MTDKPERTTEMNVDPIITYILAQHPLVSALAFWLWNVYPFYCSYPENMPAYEVAIRCPENAPDFVNIIRNMVEPEIDSGEIFMLAADDLIQELETWQ